MIKRKENIILLFASIFILFTSLYEMSSYSRLLTNVITPIFWIIFSLIIYIFKLKDNITYKARIEKVQTILIIMLAYLIIYFAFGLVFGYARSPYSHSIDGILINVWNYVLVSILTIYVESTILSTNKNSIFRLIFIVLIFSIVELNLYGFIDLFNNYEGLFNYFIGSIIPIVAENILIVYLGLTCGFYALLAFKLPLLIMTIGLPIFPDLSIYVSTVISVILYFIVFLYINFLHRRKTERTSRRNLRKVKPIKFLPVAVICLFFVLFVSGIFYYKPIGVISNSMYPVIKRGDVVIMKKANKNNIKDIKKGTVIAYDLNGSIIVHRVIDVSKDSNDHSIYTTKGDYNELPDNDIVNESQIEGIISVKIPKIGYPAVWLYELFNSGKKVGVDLGK